MTTAMELIGGAIALGAIILMFRLVVWTYLRYRGTRVITCPETKRPAAVEVNAGRAAVTAPLGKPGLRLRSCSRWPERGGCDQACLAQIEAAPEASRLRILLITWYEGKACVLCREPVGEINGAIHKPALMNPEGRTFAWEDLPPERIPELLPAYFPVCWDCHMVETFRRRFPHLVLVRPGRTSEPPGGDGRAGARPTATAAGQARLER
jgi:hypothetical protein